MSKFKIGSRIVLTASSALYKNPIKLIGKENPSGLPQAVKGTKGVVSAIQTAGMNNMHSLKISTNAGTGWVRTIDAAIDSRTSQPSAPNKAIFIQAFKKYDPNIRLYLVRVVTGQTEINLRKGPTTTAERIGSAKFNPNTRAFFGRLTGVYYQMSDGKWFQVALNNPLNKSLFCYVRSDLVVGWKDTTAPLSPMSQLALLAASDFESSMALIGAFEAVQLTSKNQNDIISERGKIQAELNKITGRTKEIEAVLNQQGSNKLSVLKIGQGGQLGVLPAIPVVVWLIIGIAAITVTALITNTINRLFTSSKATLDTSDDIWTKVRSKLTPEEYQALEDNVQEQLNDASTEGGMFGDLTSYVVGGVALFAGYKLLTSEKK